jgi:crotonobetainyl-CoA:carnitine CoA-transferase CaiB-like acyl-CoA transferase
MTPGPLAGVVVAEIGTRLAARACGSLLAQLGATVLLLESLDAPRPAPGWRAPFAFGKHGIGWRRGDPADDARVESILARADIVLTCDDVDARIPAAIAARVAACPVRCSITATGTRGPLAGRPLADGLIQALTGVMDTTGLVDGPPVEVGVPIVELSSGIYAAAGAVSAWRTWRLQGIAQSVEIALYDVGVNMMTTFLPGHFGGGASSRLGNGHSMGVPWNAYAAADGWVLICTTSDEHWRRLAELFGEPSLGTDARYARLVDRVARRGEVDAHMTRWTGAMTVAACIARLEPAGIACGAIVTVTDARTERNLLHRRRVTRTNDPLTGHEAVLIGSIIGSDAWQRSGPAAVPAPDGDRANLDALLAAPRVTPIARDADARPPLAGLRVLEIGQFTTAPLVGRHLASLGAEVLKIEPPSGDVARAWAPHREGLSLFFVMSNSGKKSVAIDLRSVEGRATLTALIERSDALVENLKPGSLARLGFTPDAIARINPRLVYCAICGFGADSAYPGKAAFDTVVQAMCGLMDATRFDGVPLKVGASIADICGGQLGLLSVLAAFEHRDRTGRGRYIDVSMQDAGAWLTLPVWNAPPAVPARDDVVRCADGYVMAAKPLPADLVADARGLSRERVAGRARERGIDCAPVHTVAEVAAHPHAAARELILYRTSASGTRWEMLRSPLGLSATPPRPGEPIGMPEPVDSKWVARLHPGNRGPASIERASGG